MEYVQSPLHENIGHIACCECGTLIQPNPSNLCAACLRTREDITQGIPKQSVLYFCKSCERYLVPPSQWVAAQLESKELLSVCLKKLKGLSKVHLVDASFVWTEPHSMRVKVKLTIQKEVSGAVLQQEFIVEFTVHSHMCDACHRVEAKDFWKAVVQIRQKAEHKKTFFFLEQLILKHRVHFNTTNVKPQAANTQREASNEPSTSTAEPPSVETGDESLGIRHIPALPRLEKQFLTAITIPLLYARLSRYMAGTDMLRNNAFEVVGVDGSFSGTVLCEENRTLAEWLQALSSNIQGLLTKMIQMTNRLLPPADHIMHMVWGNQRMAADKHQQPWKPKFLSLKSADIYLFDTPPMHSGDWSRCDAKYKVYECMFKVLKDEELPDDRQHCCSIQTGGREVVILSLDSRADLLHLEKAWYHTSNTAVRRLVSKTFGCTWRGKLSGLILDMDQGFSLYDHDSKSFLWTYRFAQLKSSSDDGRTKLKLQFNNDLTKQTDTRELECVDLQTLIFCVHAFLSAKLSTVDPSFLANY